MGNTGWHWAEVVLVVVALSAPLVWFMWRRAARLDRLHRKVSASRIALDSQLLRRASAAGELASMGVLDPASMVLVAEAAISLIEEAEPVPSPQAALEIAGLPESRLAQESALSATLRQALSDPVEVASLQTQDAAYLSGLVGAWYRAQLARRFYNEAVAQTHRARRHWWVRVFHLAGHAPWPQTVDLDDAMPPALEAIASSASTSPTQVLGSPA